MANEAAKELRRMAREIRRWQRDAERAERALSGDDIFATQVACWEMAADACLDRARELEKGRGQ